MSEWDYSEYDYGGYGTGGGYGGTDPALGYNDPIGPGLGWDTGGYPTGGYTDPIGPGLGWDAGGYPTGDPGSGLSLEQQVAQAIGQRPDLYGTSVSAGAGGGGNWLSSILGSLGGLSGVLGPALSAGGALAGGAIGAGAASNAAGLQSQALNRGIDLQTAQWLQQQQNLAPYLQAGQQGLSTLQQLAGRETPGLPATIPTISGAGYALPPIAPTWGPQAYRGPQYGPAGGFRNTKASGSGGWSTPGFTGGVDENASTNFGDGMQTGGNMVQDAAGNWVRSGAPQQSAFGPDGAAPSGGNWLTSAMLNQGAQVPWAGDYRWTPGQGPQAQNYRYTPGQTPDAAAYQWTPGQAPSAAQYRYTPGAVPTLSGKELLANDPGVQFRQDEARKALEGSAAARGDLLSGQNLKALQSRSQDLASQEYGNAFARASQQAQLREQWGQAASQMGFGQAADEARLREGWAQQASQQGFGQAEAASRLREQVNQVASQQGWSQAQAEAVFREQMAQQASQQGWGQALQGQQTAWQQGLTGQQWEQQQRQKYDEDVYNRMFQQSQTQYGRDVAQNATDYERQQNAYRQQLAQHLLPWEQNSVLASLGGNATSIYGTQGGQAASGISNLLAQLGSTQAMGTLGQAGQWNQAIAGGVGGLQNVLRGLNA